MDLDTLEHIPHDDKSRYENLKIAPELGRNNNAKGSIISLSEQIVAKQPWTIYDRMTNWNIISMFENNYWTCCDASRKPPADEIDFRPPRRR
jgi:hypothetical protein